MPQPALSQTINHFEQAPGGKLFARITHTVALTEHRQRLLTESGDPRQIGARFHPCDADHRDAVFRDSWRLDDAAMVFDAGPIRTCFGIRPDLCAIAALAAAAL